jgi:hypothetical protein
VKSTVNCSFWVHVLPWYSRDDCSRVSMPGMNVKGDITVGVPNILVNRLSNFALVHILDRLRSHRLAVDIALFIQNLLKRIVLPPEYVVAMVPIPSA